MEDKSRARRNEEMTRRDKWKIRRDKWKTRRDKWKTRRDKWKRRRDKWKTRRDKMRQYMKCASRYRGKRNKRRKYYEAWNNLRPVIEVILSFAQESRQVSIVAAAFASRSDSSLR